MEQSSLQQDFELAEQHHVAGRLPEAEEIYRRILALEPQHTAAMQNLSILCAQSGRKDESLDLSLRVAALKPDSADAQANLGNAYQAKGQLADAIAAFRGAIALRPDFPQAYSNLGNALRANNQLDEAISAFRQAIALNAGLFELYNNLGDALKEKHLNDEAISAYRQALALNPNLPQTHYKIGGLLRDSGRFEDAAAEFRHAIALKPNYPGAYNGLGLSLAALGRLDDAIAAIQQAIILQPSHFRALTNLGVFLREKGQVSESIAAFRRAIEIEQDYVEGHHNLAISLLLLGEMDQGWSEYEWRRSIRRIRSFYVGANQPFWEGSDLHGRAILLFAEQGFGDTIQFIRYVAMVTGRGGRVIAHVPAPLLRLFRQIPGVQCWLSGTDQPPHFDVQCALPSLPRMFRTTLATVPNAAPYLRADPALVESWSRTLGPADGRLRVGLAWAGSPNHKNDRNRSIALKDLLPLRTANVSLHSLQEGPGAGQIQDVPELGIIDHAAKLTDFAETAGLIANLDLVISVDTAVAHLAGALARPVWIMLPFVPDFRWLLEREDNPWYPTMRLFRQTSRGDWGGVIQRVVESLDTFARNRGADVI